MVLYASPSLGPSLCFTIEVKDLLPPLHIGVDVYSHVYVCIYTQPRSYYGVDLGNTRSARVIILCSQGFFVSNVYTSLVPRPYTI